MPRPAVHTAAPDVAPTTTATATTLPSSAAEVATPRLQPTGTLRSRAWPLRHMVAVPSGPECPTTIDPSKLTPCATDAGNCVPGSCGRICMPAVDVQMKASMSPDGAWLLP